MMSQVESFNSESPILRLPQSIRVYIFGFAGLGAKLLPASEAPWSSIYLEYGSFEAKVQRPNRDNDLGPAPAGEEEQLDELEKASQLQAFGHPLYSVCKQFRLEAKCALLRYNTVVLLADPKSVPCYSRWDPERVMALRDVAIIPDAENAVEFERLGQLLKARSDLSRLKVQIQQGLYYASLQDFGFQPEYWIGHDTWFESTSTVYPLFKGVQDFFVYYSSHFDLEIKHEKIVMGQQYDSASRGKLSPDERDWDEPWCRSNPPQPMTRCPFPYDAQLPPV